MQLTFKEIGLRNFLSFGKNWQKITLDTEQYQIITGLNKDKSIDDDGNRNGCGKCLDPSTELTIQADDLIIKKVEEFLNK